MYMYIACGCIEHKLDMQIHLQADAYSATKLEAERIVQRAALGHGESIYILRGHV